ETMVLHEVGYSATAFERASARRLLPERHKSFYESKLDTKQKLFAEFLSSAFTEPTTSHYALTSSIADLLFSYEGFSGVMYPAAARAAGADNVALVRSPRIGSG